MRTPKRLRWILASFVLAVLLFSQFQVPLAYAAGGTPPATTSSTPAGTSVSPSCESTGGPLSWFLCAAIKAIGDAETTVEGIVTSLLKTQPIDFGATGTCTSTSQSCTNAKLSAVIFKVWSDFRIYGDVILVLALLVIVIGEAMGGGMIEAYTVRKVLPRILVAAILINISIYIVAFMEDIMNILGGGIQSVIEAPFKSAAGSILKCGSSKAFCIQLSGGTGAVFTLGITALVAGAFFAASIGLILMVVLMSLVAALGVLIILTIRQGLLVFLILISPVAFALYCLPNTEQYFKKWWDLLIKTLVVYPIITSVFAVAYVAAVVMSNFGIKPQILGQSMAVMAAVAPMFLIPFAFRLSGGAIGSISGAVSKLTSRVNRPLAERSKKMVGQNFQRRLEGNTFRNAKEHGIRSSLNRGLQTAAIVGTGKAGVNVFKPKNLRNNVSAVKSSLNLSELDEVEQNDHEFSTWKQDDELSRAATESTDDKSLEEAFDRMEARRAAEGKKARFATQQERDEAAAMINRFRKRVSADTFKQATALHALAGGTAYDDAADAWEAIAAAAGTDMAMLNTLVGRGRSVLMQAGRVDQGGASFGTTQNNARLMLDDIQKYGEVRQETKDSVNKAIYASAAESNEVGQVIRGKPKSAEHIAQAHADSVNDIVARLAEGQSSLDTATTPEARLAATSAINAAENDLDEELASTMGLYDYMASAAPNIGREYLNKLMNVTVANPGARDPNNQVVSVFDAANNPARTSRPNFQRRRRDYASAAAAQGANMAIGPLGPPTPGAPGPGPGTPPPPPTTPGGAPH